MADTAKYKSFIGKYLTADGWHYDNGGGASGTITDITESRGSIVVHVDRDTNSSMQSFSFTRSQMDTLLSDGKLPAPNRLLNTGTSAFIHNSDPLTKSNASS